MTATEWFTCGDPDEMLELLVGNISRPQLLEYVRQCWARITRYLPPGPHDTTVVDEFARLAPQQSDSDAVKYASEAALKAARWAPDLWVERSEQAALLRGLVKQPPVLPHGDGQN